MNRIAGNILKIATELVFDREITFIRDDGTDQQALNQLHYELQSYVDRIRHNEGIPTCTLRIDDDNMMRVMVGVTDHEAKDAILNAVSDQARALSHKYGIRIAARENNGQ